MNALPVETRRGVSKGENAWHLNGLEIHLTHKQIPLQLPILPPRLGRLLATLVLFPLPPIKVPVLSPLLSCHRPKLGPGLLTIKQMLVLSTSLTTFSHLSTNL